MMESRVPERPAEPLAGGRDTDREERVPPAGGREPVSGLPRHRSEALEAELAALEAMLAMLAREAARRASRGRTGEMWKSPPTSAPGAGPWTTRSARRESVGSAGVLHQAVRSADPGVGVGGQAALPV
nr:MAG: hypothetical protein DIU58_18395 [Sphaerobacter thermophilus]